MAIPVLLSDGQTNIAFENYRVPVALGEGTINSSGTVNITESITLNTHIVQDSFDDFVTGQQEVGISSVNFLTVPAGGSKKGAFIKAYGTNDTATNTVPVFIGDSGVTVNTGFPLGPGESIFLSVSSNTVYAVASSNNQNIAWVTV